MVNNFNIKIDNYLIPILIIELKEVSIISIRFLKSINQLNNWFNDDDIINDMIKNNAKIVIYSGVSSDVIITEKQSAFLSDKFIRKRNMKLETLLKRKSKIKKLTR